MLNELPERLVKELGEEAGGLAVKVVEGSIMADRSKLKRLPDGMILSRDGAIRFDKSRGATQCPSIDMVFQLIDNVIQTNARNNNVAWLTEDDKGVKRIPFVPWGTEDNMQAPYITYRVLRTLPGAFGKGPEMAPNTRQRNTALRDIVPDPEHPDSEIFIYAHRFDHQIELEVGGLTAHEVDKLRSWLETTLVTNMWYLKYSGVVEFLFSERLADQTRKIEGKSLHCRPLKYFVQTEQLSWYRLNTLKELCLQLTIEA